MSGIGIGIGIRIRIGIGTVSGEGRRAADATEMDEQEMKGEQHHLRIKVGDANARPIAKRDACVSWERGGGGAGRKGGFGVLQIIHVLSPTNHSVSARLAQPAYHSSFFFR